MTVLTRVTSLTRTMEVKLIVLIPPADFIGERASSPGSSWDADDSSDQCKPRTPKELLPGGPANSNGLVGGHPKSGCQPDDGCGGPVHWVSGQDRLALGGRLLAFVFKRDSLEIVRGVFLAQQETTEDIVS